MDKFYLPLLPPLFYMTRLVALLVGKTLYRAYSLTNTLLQCLSLLIIIIVLHHHASIVIREAEPRYIKYLQKVAARSLGTKRSPSWHAFYPHLKIPIRHRLEAL